MSLLSHEITAPLWEACIKIFLPVEGIFIWSQTDSMFCTTLKSTVPQKNSEQHCIWVWFSRLYCPRNLCLYLWVGEHLSGKSHQHNHSDLLMDCDGLWNIPLLWLRYTVLCLLAGICDIKWRQKEEFKISVMSFEDVWGKTIISSRSLNPLTTDFAECSKESCCEICLTSSKIPAEAKLALK